MTSLPGLMQQCDADGHSVAKVEMQQPAEGQAWDKWDSSEAWPGQLECITGLLFCCFCWCHIFTISWQNSLIAFLQEFLHVATLLGACFAHQHAAVTSYESHDALWIMGPLNFHMLAMSCDCNCMVSNNLQQQVPSWVHVVGLVF